MCTLHLYTNYGFHKEKLICCEESGREVTTLVNGVEEPGYKSVTLDASRLSSGVYYYRLQAGNYVETKKLILMK